MADRRDVLRPPRAGLYTFLYIAARGAGKYFGARFGAKAMKMPGTVQKYLGLTLLPHSGVSLVFTGIACTTLAARSELVGIVQGTIAAAADLVKDQRIDVRLTDRRKIKQELIHPAL